MMSQCQNYYVTHSDVTMTELLCNTQWCHNVTFWWSDDNNCFVLHQKAQELTETKVYDER
jgi:hypothetical protein